MILPISLPTLLGTTNLWGHAQEDREAIRNAHDLSLFTQARNASAHPLPVAHRHRFFVAPLDILVTAANGRKRFHLIEMNGTGLGGLTNLPLTAIQAILDSLAEIPGMLPGPNPLVLIGVSGKEANDKPRANRLLYEKVLYAEAISQGFTRKGVMAEVLSPDLFPSSSQPGRPTIVLGYMKDFYPHLQRDGDRLTLRGRPVDAVVNDRFFLNILQYLKKPIRLDQMLVANRSFAAGADKGIAISLLNEFMETHGAQFPSVAAHTPFARAESREALLGVVRQWLREKRQPVLIKPRGTGLGHGIEFFLDPDEPVASIEAKIQNAISRTEEFYGIAGGAFPFSLFPFIDTCTIQNPAHRFDGHKYELRIVVYREGDSLFAAPSIMKVSCERFERESVSRQMLINNITSGAEQTATAGIHYMLPLCHEETLELLGIQPEQLMELCRFATAYVASVLARLDSIPAAASSTEEMALLLSKGQR